MLSQLRLLPSGQDTISVQHGGDTIALFFPAEDVNSIRVQTTAGCVNVHNCEELVRHLLWAISDSDDIHACSWKSVSELLQAVNSGVANINGKSYKGIIDQARGWIADGWQMPGDAGPAEIAAALDNEAATQEICVVEGSSDPDYPMVLRALADQIRYEFIKQSRKEAKARAKV